MKISKNFKRNSCSGFYRTMDSESMAVCMQGVNHLLGGCSYRNNIVKLTLSTTNPKKKGFKVCRATKYDITIGDLILEITYDQKDLFESLDLINKPFWLKAEVV